MQMHSSYVVTDPKGTVLVECGHLLARGRPLRNSEGKIVYQRDGKNGIKKDKKGKPMPVYEPYKIKVFNTIDFAKSMHYNPFAYISKKNREKDILKFVEVLIKNTSSSQQPTGDDFWVKAEKLLYTSYIALIFTLYGEDERNFETLIEMINASECREDDETFKNAMDIQFGMLETWLEGKFPSEEEIDEALENEGGNSGESDENSGETEENESKFKFEAKAYDEYRRFCHLTPKSDQQRLGAFALKQYKAYKLAAGKTAKSILISCSTRLAPFAIDEVLEITSYDELHLDTLGDELSALFVIISDTDATFNFLVAIMYSQLFNLLCTKADNSDGGRLQYHVRCLLDEFANIGEIPQFEKLIATIRSREISASIILQAKSQLKAIYKDNADTIEGNCDTMLFLGGKEKSTLKEISESLGKETIYKHFIENEPTMDKMPLLSDLQEELHNEGEVALRVANSLEMFVNGSQNLFNHKTNIDMTNRIICFDIKELGNQLKKVGMLIVQDTVWNRVSATREKKKITRYYIDEFHLLLKEEQTAKYSAEIWKRFRKWGGVPTGITQNVKDLLQSQEVENIFDNSDFVYMLNQAAGDRDILAEKLHISKEQMKFVTNSGPGEGLIRYDKVLLPFTDKFPADTQMFRLMTTRPQDQT